MSWAVPSGLHCNPVHEPAARPVAPQLSVHMSGFAQKTVEESQLAFPLLPVAGGGHPLSRVATHSIIAVIA